MARDVHGGWDEEDTCTERDSDDSPILSYRYDKRRYPYRERPAERRWAVTTVAKFSFYCTAMILFCVLMYIPVYNRANEQIPKVAVAGWSIHTNRDTKIYVQPDNVTTIHEPKDVCPKSNRDKKNTLFLLIVVCSATSNFERRVAIRETWGSYKNYLESGRIFKEVQEKYKNYNYTYDLYEEEKNNLNFSLNLDRKRRDISGFGRFLPELARALQKNLITVTEEAEEKRFEDEKGDEMLTGFDMNKELNEQDELDLDYDDETNIMKIPPKGYEDQSPDLDDVINMLKKTKEFPKEEVSEPVSDKEVDFKLVFLLGLPSQDNDTDVQEKIDEEVDKYGDVIQEGFIDSYNNLTLKSIMMLKWVTNNCNESVRYILKTDDDMYVNVPNLVLNLRNRSKVHDSSKGREKEYMLIGDLICGARPVQDVSNKWYSPRYMYGGRVYPRYLSGTGYALSAPAASALYRAALRTSYFHLEDIYITGMCSVRATPRIVPRDEPGFSYSATSGGGAGRMDACLAHGRLTAHRVTPDSMRTVAERLLKTDYVDRCERWRLTKVRKDRLKPKQQNKKLSIALT